MATNCVKATSAVSDFRKGEAADRPIDLPTERATAIIRSPALV